MTKPLTEEQRQDLREPLMWPKQHDNAVRAALARLDFLERKVQAAERLVNMDIVRGVAADQCAAYDEVTE